MPRRFFAPALAGMAAALFFALPAAAQQINYNTWGPPSEPAYRDGLVPYFARVAEDTGGRFTANIFTAGQMFGPLETLAGVRDGAVQGGFVFEQFFPNEMKYTSLFTEANGLNNDPVAAAGAAMETFFQCEECQEELRATNLISLGGHATAPYMLLCTRQIDSVDQLANARVRSVTTFMNVIVETFDSAGVNVSFTEVTQAMERGNLDCVIGPESWLTTFGVTEIVKTSIPEPNFGALLTVTFVTFARDFWDTLDDDVKEALVSNMPGYVADATIGFQNERAPAVEAAKAAGMQEVDLGEAYMEKYQQFRDAEPARIVAAGEARGAPETQALLDAYLANYEKWLELSAEIGLDREKFAEALWEHVYSKLDPSAL